MRIRLFMLALFAMLALPNASAAYSDSSLDGCTGGLVIGDCSAFANVSLSVLNCHGSGNLFHCVFSYSCYGVSDSPLGTTGSMSCGGEPLTACAAVVGDCSMSASSSVNGDVYATGGSGCSSVGATVITNSLIHGRATASAGLTICVDSSGSVNVS